MIESAMLDIAPEDAMELNKKKRMLRWDAKKRKFVKVCVVKVYEIISRILPLNLMCAAAITGGNGRKCSRIEANSYRIRCHSQS